jgi:signal transduction histidine kinase
MTLNPRPLSLSALLDRVHKMLVSLVKQGVEFQSICDTDGRDWVMGDERRLQQVLTNVATNAIKYTLTGKITISVGWEGSSVRFECVDTGPGIPSSQQETLSQLFVQRDCAPGSGLRLAIAKHLVDLTSGDITVKSDPSKGPGTACVVRMDLAPCDPPEYPSKDTTAEFFRSWKTLR